MAEEIRQVENKPQANKPVAAFLKVVLGIIFLVLGIFAILAWWQDLLTIIKGCLGPFLLMAALVTFVVAKD